MPGNQPGRALDGWTGSARHGVGGTAAGTRLPVAAVLFIFSLILPLYFWLGSVRLTPFLFVLLPAFFPLFFLWLVGGLVRHRAADYLVMFYCAWSALALAIAHGLAEAVEPIGIVFVQTLGSYLMGRCLVRSKESLRRVLYLFVAIQVLLVPFSLAEAVTASPVYLDLFRKFGTAYANVVKDARWGLDRVQGPFEHPILFGIYCSSLLATVYYLFDSARTRLAQIGALTVVILNTLLSLSSGALVAMAVQIGMIAWAKLFARVPSRWRLLTLLVAAAYVTVDLISNRTPFNVFVDYLTFNSGTAYNRILIWHYGSAEVWRHPLFGIGLNEWVRAWFMSTSMDNFWLVQAVQYGLPAFFALLAAFLLIIVRAGRRVGLDEETQRLRLGVVVSFIGTAVAICTVHLWDSTFCWFMFLLGASAWLGEAGEAPGRAVQPRRPAPTAEEPEAAAALPRGPLLGNLRDGGGPRRKAPKGPARQLPRRPGLRSADRKPD